MGKYILTYAPNHHRAYANGCIYEHILIAEEKLGRELKDGEVVHHIDENKKNNLKENLIIFRTSKDHASFHGGNTNIILNKDGSASCLKFKNKAIDGNLCRICPICKKNYMIYISKMCLECNKKLRRSTMINRATLKEEIFNFSFVKVGEMHNVTDNAIRKWCKIYDLPFRRRDINKYTKEEWIKV